MFFHVFSWFAQDVRPQRRGLRPGLRGPHGPRGERLPAARELQRLAEGLKKTRENPWKTMRKPSKTMRKPMEIDEKSMKNRWKTPRDAGVLPLRPRIATPPGSADPLGRRGKAALRLLRELVGHSGAGGWPASASNALKSL